MKKKKSISIQFSCFLSPVVRFHRGQFVWLYILLSGVITHESPQGELDTRQMGSQAITQTKAHRAGRAEGYSPTVWQLEHIQTVE